MTEVALEPGLSLRLRRFGRADGDCVLLLHGLGSSGDDWAFQVGPLARRFSVLVPDLRGCGGSSVPDGAYSIARFADDLWRLLDHCGEARAALVGFSMGGAVALEMALQRPAAVDRLVLINSLPSYRVDHWRKALELHVQLTLVRLLGMRRTAKLIARRLFPHACQAAMRARVVEVIGGSAPEPYLRCARALAAWCAADRVGALQADTLMLAGEHDYTGFAEKQRWAQALGARLLKIRDSGHGTPFDAIAATNACLLAFLGGEPLPADALLCRDRAEQVPTDAPQWPEQRPLRRPPVLAGPAAPVSERCG